MKNKLYYLSTCNTCQRIMSEVGHMDKFELIDIKECNISAEDLDELATQYGSYEAVFNKRARKYSSEGWNKKELVDSDYRKLILSEYTFLKRPVFFYRGRAFAGNAKKVVQEVKDLVNA